jgi:autotransporter-associated beta strand protein
VADIGDNFALRSTIDIYRIPEPSVSDTQAPVTTTISGAAKLTLAYPAADGPRDAESMFVDPLTRDVYIVTKRETPKRVYRAAYPQSTTGTTTLELVTSFASSTWLTAADISPDGNEILVRSAENTSGRLFTRPAGGSIKDAFDAGSISVPLRSEPQGEAIGFDPLGRGYYTTSEGSNQPIFYFNRTPPQGATSYWDNDGVAAGSYLATGAGLGGSGTWDTSSLKWYNGSADVPWLAGGDAVFWGAAGTVTLSNTQAANSVTFRTNGYTLASGALNLTGPAVSVDSSVTATINSAVKGVAGLTKSGGGTLRLTGFSTYEGGTSVVAGKLIVSNPAGSGTGTGDVVVNAGAALGGIGTIQGSATNGGIIGPGETFGTLHIGGNYTQTAGGRLEVELASVGSYDSLAITGSAALAGTLAVSLPGGFMPAAGNEFQIVTASSLGGTEFAPPELPPISAGLMWSLGYSANSVTLFVSLAGDFDRSGVVDAADYVWWRKFDGSPGSYSMWRNHFGLAAPTGASSTSSAVPEPAIQVVMLVATLAVLVTALRLRHLTTTIGIPGA